MENDRKPEERLALSADRAVPKHLVAWQGDPIACLRVPGIGSSIVRLKKKEAVFYQAMPADCGFYLLNGRVKLTALSPEGREATIALMRAGDFLGEECITGAHPLRATTAIAISECLVL